MVCHLEGLTPGGGKHKSRIHQMFSTILVTVDPFPTFSTFLFLDLGIGGHSLPVPVG